MWSPIHIASSADPWEIAFFIMAYRWGPGNGYVWLDVFRASQRAIERLREFVLVGHLGNKSVRRGEDEGAWSA
jgi:hypothetical protein